MSAEQQLITIDDISAENAPTIFVAGGLSRFVDLVKEEVCGEVPDLKTKKGRERIASLSAKVSTRKTSIEKPGRDYLRHIKTLPKVVEDELREFVNAMNTLRDEVRKPLTDWEAAEVARRDGHADSIQRLKDLAVFVEQPTAAHVAQVIADLELVALDESWEEFLPEAAQVKDKSLATLRALLADRTKVEADLAAIAKFNAEQAIRDQQERDAAIACAAVEQAQQAAAEAAQAERDAAAAREQKLIDQAREAETAAANQALQLQLAAEQAERLKLQAEADRVAGIQQAERERVAAEQRQAAAVERARLDEIARQEAEAAEQRRLAEAREADKAHKGAIYKAAKEAFMDNNMTEDCARLAVKLIASGMIPNIKITY